ncbi:MAG: ABC transporter ATP-binding protein [Deltaproteobacteria bacterium]|jgi:iron complex transport system ATP-binding protein|nr:ABC transporter ATP-binding protein [Deltaproteobacteria bacterium]
MPESSPPLLELKKITVGYRQPVVSDLSLAFGRGLFVSLLGANGSGKTTLLRTISKHIKPLSGQAFINGQALDDIKPANLAKILSVVLTDRSSAPMLRSLEFVALGRHPHSDFLGRLSDRDLTVVESALAAVQGANLADRFVDELSDGERQKIVLARALAQEPTLLLLDEPTAHLDLRHRLEILAILRRLCRSRNLSVLAAVHDVESAAKVSDLTLTIKDGKLTAFGQPETILTPESVRELYSCPQANFDSALGGLEMASDGQAGRAFVLAGQDTGALMCRLLAKRGYALVTGFLHASDLDAHVATALGARVLTVDAKPAPGSATPSEKPLDKIDPDFNFLFDQAIKELTHCDLLAVAPLSPATPESLIQIRARLWERAKSLGLPILELGSNGDLSPIIEALDRLTPAHSKVAA